MKVDKTLVAITASLLLNSAVVSGFAISARDLVAPFKGLSLHARGRPGGSSRGGTSGSGPGSKGSKKSSRLNKGASRQDADAELSEWGMARSDSGVAEGAPAAFGWQDRSTDLYQRLDGDWMEYGIDADSAHQAEYGRGPIYAYSTNQAAGAFHTDYVSTSEDPETHQPRDLPTSRRALTYNAWIAAGGDPTKLEILSDDNIINPQGREAFENTFAARGVAVEANQYIQVRRSDPEWHAWDDGRNPFPDGYETMTIDYTNMQSTTSSVTLFVDGQGQYHAVHTLEHVPDLERRLQRRAEYFMRRNLTDPWLI
ncbi:hypothetical protein GQX73_g5989 [Xylaria multiplex]|uniref:Uncharacterized protein n=1 Tax=Xylaria multiplex TaxID=323545 RepID=A0A7C8MQ12_9PEZI|nr:hypothetical protein GQX73_g5989 [Xylaria multiplex]